MTPHDAATRERVLEASLRELRDAMRRYEADAEADAPIAHCEMMQRADAALSALQPPPKGWVVSQRTRDVMDAIPPSMSDDDAARKVTPHLLRDLADGVSEQDLRRAFVAAHGLGNDGLSGRLFLRTLADTLEGKA